MPVRTNWNGEIDQNSDPTAEWSSRGGKFTSKKNITTYFPIPSIYRNQVRVIKTYEIPKKYENRPDLIAKELYNSEDYWWLVYWMNNILDPFSGLSVGTKILVANFNDVKSLLG